MVTVFSCLSTFLFYIGFVNTEKIPVPENVRVLSQDMGLQLKWDPPKNTTNKLFNFTAELKGWSDFEPVCLSTSSVSCDFTDSVTSFGTYHLRVRTELNGEISDWVETEEVAVDKITVISAPHVELRSRKGQTEVDITDPPMRKKNLRDVFGSISYFIHYWKKGDTTKEELIRDQNIVMLSGVEPLEIYCVQAAVLYLKNKTSQLSNVTCVTNTASDEVELWVIAVVLLVSFLVVLIAVVLLFLAAWYSYKMCRIMYPDAKLPEHLKQYLSERPQSSMSSVMQPQLKESFYEVSILQEDLAGNTKQTEEPIRIQDNTKDCWTVADMSETDEEQRLLGELRL